ncbi:altronate dehydratase family protein [Sphingomonas sp. RP10(2022)]|uniref:Altronate dehydratase family protein n=1 Tax=Sphingomonas liriopis TaxID=2949094 RepID=A0A9X2KR21_9SPHN|nr:altronate dehydratase family protein [Sphingomonas liriopis]MCP3735565.1 altronate dehydratase family protein [Sphingomonas liriopis]
MAKALTIAPGDSVATLLEDAQAGDTVAGVVLRSAVPRGHKVALAGIPAQAPVVKYGFPIGHARRAIASGEHVHSDNLATALAGTGHYSYAPKAPTTAPSPASTATFEGYVRADGRVGTRNEIWVLPTVGCVARTAERIAKQAGAQLVGQIDGVHAFTHPHGCSQLGQDLDGVRAILASLACHPNAGGVLLVGLGCEENQVLELLAAIPPERHAAIRYLTAQFSTDEVEEGVALVAELAAQATVPRQTVGLDRLVLGVKCGGSDGLSGLTANPLVGRISDRVGEAGGRVVFTEIPEMFGAEQMLMDRAADAPVFDAMVGVINGFRQYFIDHGEPISENPSPGNVAGGITTLEEKSLGAVQKAGTGRITDVIGYGARVRSDGLTLLEAPGNDAVSSTALAAAGATVILFTTGRGTPLGFPVPTVKIASNSDLAARKPGWIDFDAGQVLTGGFEGAEAALLARICGIASGAATAAETNDEREIAIWKRGVTL